jgi:hypothetical protein
MVRVSEGSEPLVKTMLAEPADSGVSVTVFPLATALTTSGLLDATVKLSACRRR